MKFAFFYHSLVSDWNNGNAHFLRGTLRALQARGHQAICYEPYDNWSLRNLQAEEPNAVARFARTFPDLHYARYRLDEGFECTVREALKDVDVAVVHEWNDAPVVQTILGVCRQQGIPALFHDTHYRVVLDPDVRRQLALGTFAAILAYSPSVARHYRALGFENVHVVHEAADVTVFAPRAVQKRTDVVFVGNYGDGDRSDEIESFVFGPRRSLPHLRYAMYGVRYPENVVGRMRNGLNVDYRGWLPNADVPDVYSASKVVLHVPRRQYVELLPGTPTIRVFEALASGACLVSLPWPDEDNLFCAGKDFAVVRTPAEMRDMVQWLCEDEAARTSFGVRGREAILARHTCDHRAEQILDIVEGLR